MRAAWARRLARAEVRGRRLPGVLVLGLVVALASAALVTGLLVEERAGDRWDAAFAEAHGAHVTVTSDDPAALASVAADPRVADATHPYRSVDGTITTGTGDVQTAEARVREVAGDDLPPIARPLLRQGRWVAAGAADEIVLDRSFAIARHVDVGDTVVVRSGPAVADLRVAGVAVDLIDCFFPQCDPTTAWVDPAAFAPLATAVAPGAPGGPSDTTFLRLHDPSTRALDAFTTSVLDRWPDVGTMDWRDTRSDAVAFNGVFATFLAIFGVFVLLAAMFVVASAMATRTLARRREIGLLKAVGVTPGQVTRFTVAFHAVVALVGAGLGWVGGSLLAGPLQLRMAEVLGEGPTTFRLRDLAVTLVVVEVLVVLATLGAAWRAGRLPTAAALAGDAHPGRRSTRRGLNQRLATAGWTGRHPVVGAAVRQAATRPARAVATVAAAAVAVVAVFVTLGFDRTTDRALADPAVTGNPFAGVVEAGALPPQAVPGAVRAVPGVAAVVGATDRRVLHGEGAFTGRALDGDLGRAGYVVREGRMLAGRGEAVVGYGLAKRFGLHVGDRFPVTVDGRPLDLAVVGWYAETEDTGEILLFSMDDLRSVDPTAGPDRWLVRSSLGTAEAARDATVDGLRAALPQVDVRRAVVAPDDELSTFRLAFLLVSALLGLVALANLATTVRLVQREQRRDGAVRRAVGFTPGQALATAALGSGLLALLAGGVGLGLGHVVESRMTQGVSEGIGVGPGFGLGPSTASLAVLVPAAAVGGAVLGLLTAWGSARRPVVAALHDE
jgi:putative ABC transport system permease protein